MKQKIIHHYKKPFIKGKKIRINFFSSSKFNFGDGDLLARYCGQCSDCVGCFVPNGCDVVSC